MLRLKRITSLKLQLQVCLNCATPSKFGTWLLSVVQFSPYSNACHITLRHLHESQNLGGGGTGGLGGKTPYGGRTPARTPGPGASAAGHQTPGPVSVRQVGRTPNPYGGPGMPPSAGLGGITPYGAGYQTPGHPSRSTNGSRPIVQEAGGWGSASGKY